MTAPRPVSGPPSNPTVTLASSQAIQLSSTAPSSEQRILSHSVVPAPSAGIAIDSVTSNANLSTNDETTQLQLDEALQKLDALKARSDPHYLIAHFKNYFPYIESMADVNKLLLGKVGYAKKALSLISLIDLPESFDNFSKAHTQYTKALESIIWGINKIVEFSDIVLLKAFLSLLKNERNALDQKIKEHPNFKFALNDYLDSIDEQIEKLNKEIDKSVKTLCLNTACELPSVTHNIYVFVHWIKHLKEASIVTVPLQLAASTIKIVLEAFKVKQSETQKKEHSQVAELFDPSKEIAADILYKRKGKFWQDRLKDEEKTLNKWLENYQEDKLLRELKEDFELKGLPVDFILCDIEPKPATIKDLKELMKIDPQFKQQLVERALSEKLALGDHAMTLLKDRIHKTEKMNKNFYSFKAIISKLNLGTNVTQLAALIGVVVTATLIPGMPLFILGLPGLLGILLIVALPIVSIFFLYKNKPNLFRVLFDGSFLKEFFYKIPTFYYIREQEKKKIALEEATVALTFLEREGILEDNIPKSLIPLVQKLKESDKPTIEKEKEKYRQKQAELEGKLVILEDRIKEYEDKQKEYTKKIEKAREADYERITETSLNDLDTLAEAFVKAEFWDDFYSRLIIEQYTQTSFKKPENEEQLKAIQTDVTSALKRAVLRSSKEIREWSKEVYQTKKEI